MPYLGCRWVVVRLAVSIANLYKVAFCPNFNGVDLVWPEQIVFQIQSKVRSKESLFNEK